VADPVRFPNGLKSLADSMHDLGLKVGIYSDAAEHTCGGCPGSLGFETGDAELWASWGIDYLKYDYCGAPGDRAAAEERYGRMGEALRATGRDFLYSICEWGGRDPHAWGPDVGGHMWRVSGDVFDSWVDVWVPEHETYGIGVDTSIDIAAGLHDHGGPGGWNDLDMLVVGLRGAGRIPGPGLSFLEYQTQMSMWCMAASPLMIGCDLRTLDDDTAALLTNPEVLGVNQDRFGRPAWRVRRGGGCEVWRRPLADGSVAMALVNRGSSGRDVTLQIADTGLSGGRKAVRDLWAGTEVTEFVSESTFRVQPHQTLMFKISD